MSISIINYVNAWFWLERTVAAVIKIFKTSARSNHYVTLAIHSSLPSVFIYVNREQDE